MSFFRKLFPSVLVVCLLGTLAPGFLPGQIQNRIRGVIYAEDTGSTTIPMYAQQTINQIEGIKGNNNQTIAEKAEAVQNLVNLFLNKGNNLSTPAESMAYLEGSMAVLKELMTIHFYDNDTLFMSYKTKSNLIKGSIPSFKRISGDQAIQIYNEYWELIGCHGGVFSTESWGIAMATGEAVCEVDIENGGIFTPESINLNLMQQRINTINSNLENVVNDYYRVSLSFAIKAMGTGNEANVTLSPAAIEILKQNGMENVTVKTNWGVMANFPLSTINKNNITIGFKESSPVTGSKDWVAVDEPVYQFSLTQNGQEVSLPSNVTLEIPYPHYIGNLDPEKISVYTLDHSNNWMVYNSNVKMDKFYVRTLLIQTKKSGTFTSFHSSKTFTDLMGNYARYNVEKMYARGVISGIDSAKFAPDKNVTRAEFTKMLVRILNLEDDGTPCPFTDVKSTDWFCRDVAMASKFGLVSGVGSNTFSPNSNISRQDMVTMLVRVMRRISPYQANNLNLTFSSYIDANQIASYAREPMAIAIENSLISGTTPRTLSPNATATRAMAATVIYRFYSNIYSKTFIYSPYRDHEI